MKKLLTILVLFSLGVAAGVGVAHCPKLRQYCPGLNHKHQCSDPNCETTKPALPKKVSTGNCSECDCPCAGGKKCTCVGGCKCNGGVSCPGMQVGPCKGCSIHK